MLDKKEVAMSNRKQFVSKKCHRNDTLAASLGSKKRRIEEAKEGPIVRRIVDVNFLIRQLCTGCSKCKESPLHLTKANLDEASRE